eukprot:scaffold246708_cov28-Tisochrysis_lutea.AAC.5
MRWGKHKPVVRRICGGAPELSEAGGGGRWPRRMCEDCRCWTPLHQSFGSRPPSHYPSSSSIAVSNQTG